MFDLKIITTQIKHFNTYILAKAPLQTMKKRTQLNISFMGNDNQQIDIYKVYIPYRYIDCVYLFENLNDFNNFLSFLLLTKNGQIPFYIIDYDINNIQINNEYFEIYNFYNNSLNNKLIIETTDNTYKVYNIQKIEGFKYFVNEKIEKEKIKAVYYTKLVIINSFGSMEIQNTSFNKFSRSISLSYIEVEDVL